MRKKKRGTGKVATGRDRKENTDSEVQERGDGKWGNGE